MRTKNFRLIFALIILEFYFINIDNNIIIIIINFKLKNFDRVDCIFSPVSHQKPFCVISQCTGYLYLTSTHDILALSVNYNAH